MKSLASVWSWFAVLMVVLLGFWLQLALFLVALPFDRRRAVAGRFFRLMGVTAAKLNPLWSFGAAGEVPASGPRRAVVVSNHASNADVFLISHLPWEMKWLGKSSLFPIPFLGWSMWLAGDIPVKRGARDSVEEAMRRCAGWLERDMPVMIFPEGTRSKTGELGPFKDGAFRLAIETKSALLPLAVAGTHDALPKHDWRFGRSRGRVMVGTPIDTSRMTIEDVPKLRDEARAQIVALQAKLAAL